MVYRLDRISRNISDFSSLIEELGRLGIDFVDNEAELFAPESDFDSMPAHSQEKRQALLHKLQ